MFARVSNLALKWTQNELKARTSLYDSVRTLKQIKIHENEKQIVVEGERIESPRKPYLVKPPPVADEKASKACPLCRLDLKRLDYTDILILRQFINSDGTLMSLQDSGLCGRKYKLVQTLVNKAQKCRLLPRPPHYQVYGPWDNFNTYYDWPPRYRDQPMRVIRPEYWK
ncbi:28S ribosomal protein S18a: mitochondrial-like protein [Dinothrombium tinctorium]|uniref:28S ribosomal protein S18a: mitochondrial-like protein n=1 Tax=Dinothrombium tinctorium TaxID=1965070 RepID=A0A3S3SKF3_9ACAR|nr:28S ribosomal protein S18a: mitochondrial-like protein [Dinothrombium tinctorium]